MTPDGMARLRVNGWKLLAPFAQRTEGLPSPDEWPARSYFLPLVEHGEIHGRRAVALLPPKELEGIRGPPEPLFEMTFFNRVARKYVKNHRLNVWEETERLQRALVREIEFPPGAVAVKTFWHVVKRDQTIRVQKWSWSATEGRVSLPPGLLPWRCVSYAPTDGCLTAREAFYTIRVEDPADFLCEGDCPRLERGDLLILVALHIASKQMPEWLWATFWWRDADAPSEKARTYWTCGDAQREEALGKIGPPWSNYSMDVTASFSMSKPRPQNDSDRLCGVPGKIGDDNEQWLAAYNPFVEAFFTNGLKSNCVDCHARATTNRSPDRKVPDVGAPVGPAAADFEGHIRLDYLWSLRNGLNGTEFPLYGWPKER